MKNKSIYLIYETVNCTPNGDPDNEGEQRYNEATKRAVVSDLRIKRYGRDKLESVGEQVFYFYDRESIEQDGKKLSGAAARFVAFCKDKGYEIDKKFSSEKAMDILLKEFSDVRIFGAALTSKDYKASITGALQFDAENESINEVIHGKNIINRGITSIFPSDIKKGQGSMGRDSFLKYGLFCIKGRFSAQVAKLNKASDKDVALMLTAIWDGISSANSRSKQGQSPIAFIVVEHPTELTKEGCLGRTLRKDFIPFNLVPKSSLNEIYCKNDYELDFSPLKVEIEKTVKNVVDNVTIYCDDEEFVQKHFSCLPENCKIVDPFDALINLVSSD